jgi:DtxR family transcriptional regulator, Mn-dependent transcriptional regulator
LWEKPVMNVETEVSGSIEMYLVTIATLQLDDEPVPLSLLADGMSHSPVSVNEMCRKMMERGWAAYQPYRGVKLTSEGMRLAQQVLCRRRLWEVFLVDKVGADPKEAEAFACQLEHATPDDLSRRLAAFLDYPTCSPQNKPIPYVRGDDAYLWQPARPLAALNTGERGRVVDVSVEAIAKEFLRAQGVAPGTELEVLAVASDGSLLLQAGGQCLSVSKALAVQVDVTPVPATESSTAGVHP